MRVVSIGDLVTDFYYKDNKLLGVNGGMTSHNIIANLSSLGINTKCFGVCGNDSAGLIAIKSLEDLKVDTSDIEKLDNVNTRTFHVSYSENSFISKKRCPFCNEKRWYNDSLINTNNILKKIKSDDILVFDNLNNENQIIIDKTNNLKIIDLGQYFEFENLTNEEILKKIKNKFEIINFNERVSKYLKKRFNLKEDLELYNLLNAKLITITLGENGAKFIYNNEIYSFSLETKSKVIDPTGAGDAFVSSIIMNWIKNDLVFDSNKFYKWYKNSEKLTSKVVTKMGARGHLHSLYKIKKNNETCTCKSFDIIERKKIKKCNININNLEPRIINALKSNATKKLNNINFKEEENYLFVASGGSFAAAKFASIITNEILGCNTYSLYPREVIYRNNKKIDKVILFSYSGTTKDLIESVKDFELNKKFIITKGEVEKVLTTTDFNKNNIISYRTNTNKGKERGFLSFEGALAPASIFMNYFYKEIDPEFNTQTFINNSLNYWKDFFKKEFKNINIKNMFTQGNLINIFSGDYTTSACCDTESKIIESGIINCIVHEKKNFSHGRFINYENLNNKNSIYFKQNKTNDFEKELLNYLKNGNNLIIESNYNGILCEFDLLIASQLLIYYIGKSLDIDVSKPKYSEEAMKIYFYKGEL